MSRTIKDIPYGVLARQAVEHGFIDRNSYRGYRRLFGYRSCMIRFDIAVDAHDPMLLHDWKRWANDVREEYPLDYTVEYDVDNVSHQLVDYRDDDSIDYVDVPLYEQSWITRVYRESPVLDRLWNDYNPEKYALNTNASLRNAPKINVIHASITLQKDVSDKERMRQIYWLADVPAYMESLGDKHYKYGMDKRWYNDHEDIYPERSTVKSQLRKAANMYNSGYLDDDYDDDIVYQSKPEVLWSL